MSARELLVFLKAPRPGAVKTRLAAEIGDDLAVSVCRSLATAVLEATLPGHPPAFTRRVCFAPRDGEAEVAAWLGDECLEPQSEGDLGARMARAFENSFKRGSMQTAIIGTDSLDIGRAEVEAAFDALATKDVVLRAAKDGGYTLIGLKRCEPSLFGDMAWSSETVLATTLTRASAAGLSVACHEGDSDIDTLDDLRRQWPRVRPHLDPDVSRRIEDRAFSASPA